MKRLALVSNSCVILNVQLTANKFHVLYDKTDVASEALSILMFR